ncbi:MAG: hypothetical protein QM770_08275 [Tepidisphaeraceae bacterium]
MQRSFWSAVAVVGMVFVAGCETGTVVDISRKDAAARRNEVHFETTAVTSDGLYERMQESDGAGHDKLTLKSKTPLRIRVIVEPLDSKATLVEKPPVTSMPATQPFPTPRAVEP